MAVCSDELERNNFFQTLQKKFKEKFDIAQKKCWIICVPCQSSIKDIRMSADFCDYHILKPSPFFKGHYISTGCEHGQSYEILEKHVKTTSGCIKILMEEISYNNDYKPCRILILENPLNKLPPAKVQNEDARTSNSCTDNILNIQPSSYLKVLKSFSKSLILLDKRIEQFCSSYIFLPNYLHDAAMKLQELIKWGEKVFSKESKTVVSLYEENCANFELSTSIEFYILNHVHSKLFPVIREKFCEEDTEVNKKLLSLYEINLTPDQLGINEPFCLPTPSAVVELASLNLKTSPMEKLLCLVATLEYLNHDITKAITETIFPAHSNKDIPHITSDDLIPLLAYVIVQARPPHLASNLYYIQNFTWNLSTMDKLSFSLVTFQATKEFLKGVDINLLKPSKQSIKREMSLDELMIMTVSIQNSNNISAKNKSKPIQSTIDHQLQNVTKMIEASTWELGNATCNETDTSLQKKNIPLKNSKKKDEKLGGFLSDLQQRSLGYSYGKKS